MSKPSRLNNLYPEIRSPKTIIPDFSSPKPKNSSDVRPLPLLLWQCLMMMHAPALPSPLPSSEGGRETYVYRVRSETRETDVRWVRSDPRCMIAVRTRGLASFFPSSKPDCESGQPLCLFPAQPRAAFMSAGGGWSQLYCRARTVGRAQGT
jgi:hypothetical protein